MEANMKRADAIGRNPVFRGHLGRIDAAEEDRAFCRHGLPHLLDVARIAWILNLERTCGLRKDVVYAAALLHDIGRSEQYATGEDHDVAGVRIAGEVLDDLPEALRFDPLERASILAAVARHRTARDDEWEGEVLIPLIEQADHLSRPCYACAAREACYWPRERKNLTRGREVRRVRPTARSMGARA